MWQMLPNCVLLYRSSLLSIMAQVSAVKHQLELQLAFSSTAAVQLWPNSIPMFGIRLAYL